MNIKRTMFFNRELLLIINFCIVLYLTLLNVYRPHSIAMGAMTCHSADKVSIFDLAAFAWS